MNSKEKAIELVKKFTNYFGKDSDEVNDFKAKQCALIAVDQIIAEFEYNSSKDHKQGYWQSVKQEIENL